MQHKWHKEIKAWADGAEIEARWNSEVGNISHDWKDCVGIIDWDFSAHDYRIKPQPQEPQYLYVWLDKDTELAQLETHEPKGVLEDGLYKYIGKIKLEVDDE
jgi:hypothetical protein